ncbi:nicotinate-nucleotide diphosphorylase (carboxylating) [Desulfuribacillus stibiiarsenatis]|uniref:Probable nicotinate-nucleotide pyrophosphorylase [carboxylating] n=1 Tax=Desulfuribacillus stibiiarsenatis TaxID=1390249 RepID=A0A1E5L2S9_9FIRM|nr:carboxylating nicotinate-nucleotide diphosphorylase [Desulfuribacillus stibiiarsenatis]OEH84363.1 nicotinate-nucleotide diphosphorylase (carboxylating) [Desulfuribacillus stibiiarsenatis]
MISISKLIELALEEDVFSGDITSLTTVPADAYGQGMVHMKADGVISGVEVAREVFRQIDERIQFTHLVMDGDIVTKGQTIITLEGPLRSILTGERVALNFMQRMSGIATKTHTVTSLIQEFPTRVVDTRKTTPLLRILEKQAVRDGGGKNHRFGLYDAVMIKDNHIKAAGGITKAVRAARQGIPHTMKIEVEVENFDQLREAIESKCDIIMLDNMSPSDMKLAVDRIAGRALTEASGGITEHNIIEVAQAGVDIISLGSLTHTIESLDISLDLFEKKNQE